MRRDAAMAELAAPFNELASNQNAARAAKEGKQRRNGHKNFPEELFRVVVVPHLLCTVIAQLAASSINCN